MPRILIAALLALTLAAPATAQPPAVNPAVTFIGTDPAAPEQWRVDLTWSLSTVNSVEVRRYAAGALAPNWIGGMVGRPGDRGGSLIVAIPSFDPAARYEVTIVPATGAAPITLGPFAAGDPPAPAAAPAGALRLLPLVVR